MAIRNGNTANSSRLDNYLSLISRGLWKFLGTPTGVVAILFLSFSIVYGIKNGT